MIQDHPGEPTVTHDLLGRRYVRRFLVYTFLELLCFQRQISVFQLYRCLLGLIRANSFGGHREAMLDNLTKTWV